MCNIDIMATQTELTKMGSIETQTEFKMGSISIQTDPEPVPIMVPKEVECGIIQPIQPPETSEIGIQTLSHDVISPMTSSSSTDFHFIHSTPRIKPFPLDLMSSASCDSGAPLTTDSSASQNTIKDLEERLKESERRNNELLLKYEELERQFQKKENVHLLEKCSMQVSQSEIRIF